MSRACLPILAGDACVVRIGTALELPPQGRSLGAFCFFYPFLPSPYPLNTIRGLKNIKIVLEREAKSQLRDTHFVGWCSLNLYPSAVRKNKQTKCKKYFFPDKLMFKYILKNVKKTLLNPRK